MGSATVVVWLLRTLPTHGPHRIGRPLLALAAVGISLVVLALRVAARGVVHLHALIRLDALLPDLVADTA